MQKKKHARFHAANTPQEPTLTYASFETTRASTVARGQKHFQMPMWGRNPWIPSPHVSRPILPSTRGTTEGRPGPKTVGSSARPTGSSNPMGPGLAAAQLVAVVMAARHLSQWYQVTRHANKSSRCSITKETKNAFCYTHKQAQPRKKKLILYSSGCLAEASMAPGDRPSPPSLPQFHPLFLLGFVNHLQDLIHHRGIRQLHSARVSLCPISSRSNGEREGGRKHLRW